MDEFRLLTREEIREGMLRSVREEFGDAEADALEGLSPPCVETSRAGYSDDDEIKALRADWDEAFVALRIAGLEFDATDPIAARYRAASSAVNHANRKRGHAIATNTPYVPRREPVPYDDDPDGDNWHPADVAEGTKGTCRRCGHRIYWSYDAPTGMDDDGDAPEYGWWYSRTTDTEACIPGPEDEDRWHAPTTTPPPSERD